MRKHIDHHVAMQSLRYLIIFLSILSVYSTFFIKTTDLLLFKYLDEVIFSLIISLLSAYYLSSKKLNIIHIIIVGFLFYSVLVSLIFGFNKQIIEITAQSFISVKFFIFLIGFMLLFKDNMVLLNYYFNIIYFLAFTGFIIHLIMGINFNNITDIPTFARPNIRYTGFIAHPNHMAFLTVIYVGYILAKLKANKSKINTSNLLKIISCIIIILLTDSRTSILTLIIFFVSFYWDLIFKNLYILGYVALSLLISIIFIATFTDLISSILQDIAASMTLESTYIRGNMIYLASVIFFEFFPIGTGAATFGSVLANDKVYEKYDQADRYYFVNEIGTYDSNIASIVGEYGLLGIVIFFLLFYYSYKYLNKMFRGKNIMLTSLFIIYIFYSITNPMLTNNVYILVSLPLFIKISKLS